MAKNIEIEITNITEGNRRYKIESVEKCLNGEKYPVIPVDDTKRLRNISLQINDFDRTKINKAVRNLSMTLDVPLKSAKGEIFVYKAQEDLTDRWVAKLSQINNNLYNLLIDYFDLPKVTVMSKALLRHRGKVIYSPETGKPITKAEWKKFVTSLQNFLDIHYSGIGERIILNATTLGHLLDKMAKTQSKKSVKNKRLDEIQWHGKKFDWIAENFKNMKNAIGESFTRDELSRIQVMSQSAAQNITSVTDKMRDNIQQILIDSVKDKLPKNQVSQQLFDKMVGANRDIQKIADTEIQNATNNAYINESVYNTPEGEKTYFRRVEIIDGNTCDYCKRMNGKIAVFSETPLVSDRVNDPIAEFAMWEGHEWPGTKNTVLHSYTGVFHPYCRGTWEHMDKFDIAEIMGDKRK